MMTKYIVFKKRRTDMNGNVETDNQGYFYDDEVMVIFPEYVAHSNMAELCTRERYVLSAGFIGYHDGKHFCYGRSESLDIGSRKEDAALLRQLLGE